MLCVVVFVAIGRQAHAEGNALVGFLSTAAPFLIALAVATMVAAVAGWRADGWRCGIWIWVVTWLFGLTLRSAVFGDGVVLSFALVAGNFLAATMIGWRLVAAAVQRRRTESPVPTAEERVNRRSGR